MPAVASQVTFDTAYAAEQNPNYPQVFLTKTQSLCFFQLRDYWETFHITYCRATMLFLKIQMFTTVLELTVF